jgi:hypothetical protein
VDNGCIYVWIVGYEILDCGLCGNCVDDVCMYMCIYYLAALANTYILVSSGKVFRSFLFCFLNKFVFFVTS